MIDAIDFSYLMKEVLNEKFPKYNDSWKNTGIGELRAKIDEQMKDISDIIVEKIDWDKEIVKRKLIHVANYCYFLYNNIEAEINKKVK